MDLWEAIARRRSVRRYRPQAVDWDILERVIDAARLAPSADNEQAWEFVVTRDPSKKEALSGRRYSRFLKDADAVVVVCIHSGPCSDLRRFFRIQSSAAAIQNLLLAAHAEGLGTCWVGDFDPPLVRSLFAIPDYYDPVALIAIGYPLSGGGAVPRKRPLQEVMHIEEFGRKRSGPSSQGGGGS